MITPYNLLRHELIGLEVKIINSRHKDYIGISGKIVDETKNTLIIEDSNVEKTIPKNCITLEVKLPDDAIVKINGNLLSGRPEDRIKKKFRIRF